MCVNGSCEAFIGCMTWNEGLDGWDLMFIFARVIFIGIMKSVKWKCVVDVVAMMCVVAAIVSGFVLHREVHHLYIYNDIGLWGMHEAVGLVLAAMLAMHCAQHPQWFRNYRKITVKRKRVTTILLCVGVILAASGVVLMCGSRSEEVSIIHYVLGIVFTLLAVGHVCKRWRIFKGIAAVFCKDRS